jgi:carboxyl-terminal processing protease
MEPAPDMNRPAGDGGSREEQKVQRNLTILIAVALLAVVAVLALRTDLMAFGADDGDSVYQGTKLFNEALTNVRKYYVNEVDNHKLYESAIEGMLQGLDHFSAFIPATEVDEFSKQIKGSFGGIGIVIGMEGGWLSVISPIEDAPAFRAGAVAGDKIIEIEGHSTEGLSLEQAVKKLTGEPGTKVTFTVIHEADLKRDTFTVTREVIHIKTVKGVQRDDQGRWKYLVDKDNGIAYIRLTSFTEDSVSDLRKAVEDATKEGMKSLILDLRWNGGGILKGAIGVSNLFMGDGVIVSTRGRAEA